MKVTIEYELTKREVTLLKTIVNESVEFDNGVAHVFSTPVTYKMLDDDYGSELSSLLNKVIICDYAKDGYSPFSTEWIAKDVSPTHLGMKLYRQIVKRVPKNRKRTLPPTI